MAGIDPQHDPRGARWEQRLRVPVLGAALLAVPTVLLYFSDLGSTAGTVAEALSWLIWSVFLLEAVIMLSVVAQRRAWMRGHLFGLAVLLATFPLLTKFLAALLAATAVVGTLTGDKHPTPFHVAWGLVETLPLWSLVLALGAGATLVIAVLTLRSPRETPPRPRAR